MGHTHSSKYGNSENELYIPISTINQYICPNKTNTIYLCDYNSDEIIFELSSSDSLFFTSINKVILNNSNYLVISKMRKNIIFL